MADPTPHRYGIGDLWILQLSGLSQSPGSVAWRNITYAPTLVGDLTAASTRFRTPRGVAAASWTLTGGKKLAYDVAVPVGATGLVYLNGTGILESGRPVKVGQDGILGVRVGCQRTLVTVGSGEYHFEATMR